jgi:hypothetical protein
MGELSSESVEENSPRKNEDEKKPEKQDEGEA